MGEPHVGRSPTACGSAACCEEAEDGWTLQERREEGRWDAEDRRSPMREVDVVVAGGMTAPAAIIVAEGDPSILCE